jgi:hypothetical protein
MDADLQHDPAILSAMLNALRVGPQNLTVKQAFLTDASGSFAQARGFCYDHAQ